MDEGELRNGYSVTMFMDIIGSTKLGVIFSPETVFTIKNDIIRCAINGTVCNATFSLALITSKEGHHSITHNTMHMSIERVYYMFKSTVIPKLNELGVDENLGIRIGIDYGAHDQARTYHF
jgi:adenylate cyclase